MMAIEIIVALLAAWGLVCALKLFTDGFIIPRRCRPERAVRLDGSENDEEIIAMCENARASWLCCGRATVVLIPGGKGNDLEDRLHRLAENRNADGNGICVDIEIIKISDTTPEE